MCIRDRLYYNAGVILFDLNNWRKYHCEQSLLDVLRKDRVRYFTADQDILNLVLGEKMMPLALRYNFPTTMLMFSPEEIYRIYDLHENRFYTIEQMKKALDEPGIHHMGLYFGLRPWNGGEDHPQRAVYEKYRNNSPFCDFSFPLAKVDLVFCFQKLCYYMCPRVLYVFLHKKILQSYLKKEDKKMKALP